MKRIAAAVVGFVGFNALVAAVQSGIAPGQFWVLFAWDCAGTAAAGVVVACLFYAIDGSFE